MHAWSSLAALASISALEYHAFTALARLQWARRYHEELLCYAVAQSSSRCLSRLILPSYPGHFVPLMTLLYSEVQWRCSQGMGMTGLMHWVGRGLVLGLALVILAGCRVKVDVELWDPTPTGAYPYPAPYKPLFVPTVTPPAYPAPASPTRIVPTT